MPVVRKKVGEIDLSRAPRLWDQLAAELTQPKAFGQPMVSEEEFPRTGLIGVSVFWDRWSVLFDPERSASIVKAYEAAGRGDVVSKIAFAVGYTIPEAVSAGLLRFWVAAQIKSIDTPEQKESYRQAMIAVGASTLADPNQPSLRLQTEDQAFACCQELKTRYPELADVWMVYGE